MALNEDDFDTQLLCPDVILEENMDDAINSDETMCESVNEDENSTISPMNFNIIEAKAYLVLNYNEELLSSQIYKTGNPIQKTKIHCTSCNIHLGSALNNMDYVYVHPLLNVLVCKECFDYYTGGEFEKDEDGTEKFCRWCGQGGQVFCCSKCPMVFCKLCIKINFPASQYTAIRDAKYWECFCCDPIPLMALKVQCYELARYVHREFMKLRNNPESDFYKNIDHSRCCLNDKPKKRSKEDDPDFNPKDEVIEKSLKKMKIPKQKNIFDDNKHLGFAGFDRDLINPPPKITFPLQPTTSTPISASSSGHVKNPFSMSVPYPDTTNIVYSIKENQKLFPTEFNNYVYRKTQIVESPHIPKLSNPLPLLPRLMQMKKSVITRNIITPMPIKNSNPDDLQPVFLRKARLLDKTMLSIALSNSTFASTLLKINQMTNKVQTSQEITMIYNSFQQSLKMMTESLISARMDNNFTNFH